MSSIMQQQVLSWLVSGFRAILDVLLLMSSSEPEGDERPFDPEVAEAVEQGVEDVLRGRLSTMGEGGLRDLM